MSISILRCLDWRLFYEIPWGDDNLYIAISLLVHHECLTVPPLPPVHVPLGAFDTLAWSEYLAAPACGGPKRRAGSRVSN